jgi:hypothetical protein
MREIIAVKPTARWAY